MVVEGPEVLHCVECDDGALVVVPVSGPVVAEKPQRPGILKVNFVQEESYLADADFDLQSS